MGLVPLTIPTISLARLGAPTLPTIGGLGPLSSPTPGSSSGGLSPPSNHNAPYSSHHSTSYHHHHGVGDGELLGASSLWPNAPSSSLTSSGHMNLHQRHYTHGLYFYPLPPPLFFLCCQSLVDHIMWRG
jgi:hypothetical protein